MLEESGTVLAVKNDELCVETISRSSCSRCSSSGCSTSVISKLFGLRRNRIIMKNSLGAKPGDRVVIGIPDSLLVKASIWAYLLPLASMVMVAWSALLLGASDSLQALCALIGLVGGLFAVNRLTMHQVRREQFSPKLLRIQGLASVNVGLTELIDF